ncbi:efflux RND transporter periplasmic adaptor subunit [Jiulongibacter sediminis]|uniref:Cation transporter n=1 Tax=Jiulongibacter sediminis TaxID=1605367 RepID=A0A0P7C3Y5_9BACT|nr:efflux RND transporter periplasmic adaptor subunit [Jiulongibacter sediminis]KPM46566.1 cation transporter [Jiulongibacter sediminis]TBX21109.1 cation transporter [Jiulongibacter sediminis]
MKYIKFIIAVFMLAFSMVLTSCGSKKNQESDTNQEVSKATQTEEEGNNHSSEEGVHLTKEQANTIGLELGDLSTIKVNDFVNATGSLGLPPNALSSVSAKTNGIIKGTKKFVEGDYIKKGAIIAYLENTEFIITQQDYLEAKAQLNLKLLEAERQRSLVESNAGVIKNLQNAQAEVAVLEAKTQGLAKQLSFLGISTSDLTPSNIRQKIAIVAPMSGYISKINFHNGMYAQSSVSLMDIISSEHLHLELDVFEKDIASIKKGQKISYTVPALGQTIYYGRVDVIGKEFNSDTKTVRVHGHLDGIKPLFLKDLFLNAKIFLTNVESSALPEDAIINDGANSFIYVANEKANDNEIEFVKINIIQGSKENGYASVKLIDEIPEGMQIVTKGAYYVYAQSKAGELEHED